MTERNWSRVEDELSSVVEGLQLFNRFYMPVVIGVGLVGNALSILVFQLSKLRHFPSSLYLSALATADSGMLLCQLFLMSASHLLHLQGLCQTIYYVNNFFSFLSVWYVVSFTIERFIVVVYPLKRLSWCTKRRARLIIALVTLAPAVFNIHVFFLLKVQERGGRRLCDIPGRLMYIASLINYADNVLTLVVPMLLIVVLNVRIAQYMWRALSPSVLYRSRSLPDVDNGMSTSDSKAPLHATAQVTASKAKSGRVERVGSVASSRDEKITKMLLTVSVIFVTMNLPDHVMRILYLFLHATGRFQALSGETKLGLRVAQLGTNVLFQTNFATNFFLYNIVGHNFRRQLRKLVLEAVTLRCLKSKLKARTTLTMTTRNSTQAVRQPTRGLQSQSLHQHKAPNIHYRARMSCGSSEETSRPMAEVSARLDSSCTRPLQMSSAEDARPVVEEADWPMQESFYSARSSVPSQYVTAPSTHSVSPQSL